MRGILGRMGGQLVLLPLPGPQRLSALRRTAARSLENYGVRSWAAVRRSSWMPITTPRPPFFVERTPGGGYRVMLREHHRPVSRHDTEEEAEARMAAYLRGWVFPEAELREPEQSS